MEKALEKQALGLLGERFYPYVRNRWRYYPSALVWQYALCYLRQARFANTRYMDKALSTAWRLLVDAPNILFDRVRRLLSRLGQLLRQVARGNPSGGDGKVTGVMDSKASFTGSRKVSRWRSHINLVSG